MNIIRNASHVGCYGMSGCGKTSYGERYIVGGHHSRVFIFDHQGEFQSRLRLVPVYSIEELISRASNERFLCFDFSLNYEGQLEESFDEFCDVVFRLNKELFVHEGMDSLFVCDELQQVVGPHQCPKPLKNIMQTGRRNGIDTLLLGQQPNEIHNTVRNQMTELVLFRLIDENALKFSKNLAIDTSHILTQEKLCYTWYNIRTGELRKSRIDFKNS